MDLLETTMNKQNRLMNSFTFKSWIVIEEIYWIKTQEK